MGNKKSGIKKELDETSLPTLDEIEYNLQFVTNEYVNYTSIDAECFDTAENMYLSTDEYNHIIDIGLEFNIDSNNGNPRCINIHPTILRLSLDCNQCKKAKQPVGFNTSDGRAYCKGMCYRKMIKGQITKMESYVNGSSFLFIFSIALRYKPFFISKGYGNHSITGPVPKYGYCDIGFKVECKECGSNIQSVVAEEPKEE